jgi:hypothetical protein
MTNIVSFALLAMLDGAESGNIGFPASGEDGKVGDRRISAVPRDRIEGRLMVPEAGPNPSSPGRPDAPLGGQIWIRSTSSSVISSPVQPDDRKGERLLLAIRLGRGRLPRGL